MPNPESSVVDKINRLEHDWNAQDEIIDWQLEQGRNTGEYYDQTGAESGFGVNGDTTSGWCLASHLANVNVYGVVNPGTATATITLTYDDYALTVPGVVDDDGTISIPDFVDIGHIADDTSGQYFGGSFFGRD